MINYCDCKYSYEKWEGWPKARMLATCVSNNYHNFMSLNLRKALERWVVSSLSCQPQPPQQPWDRFSLQCLMAPHHCRGYPQNQTTAWAKAEVILQRQRGSSWSVFPRLGSNQSLLDVQQQSQRWLSAVWQLHLLCCTSGYDGFTQPYCQIER